MLLGMEVHCDQLCSNHAALMYEPTWGLPGPTFHCRFCINPEVLMQGAALGFARQSCAAAQSFSSWHLLSIV